MKKPARRGVARVTDSQYLKFAPENKQNSAGNVFPFAVVPGLTDTCLQNSCPGDDAGCNLHLAQTQEQRRGKAGVGLPSPWPNGPG